MLDRLTGRRPDRWLIRILPLSTPRISYGFAYRGVVIVEAPVVVGADVGVTTTEIVVVTAGVGLSVGCPSLNGPADVTTAAPTTTAVTPTKTRGAFFMRSLGLLLALLHTRLGFSKLLLGHGDGGVVLLHPRKNEAGDDRDDQGPPFSRGIR